MKNKIKRWSRILKEPGFEFTESELEIINDERNYLKRNFKYHGGSELILDTYTRMTMLNIAREREILNENKSDFGDAVIDCRINHE